MIKFWLIFVIAVLVWIGALAWDDQWVGRDALRVFMLVLVMIGGLSLWSCLGRKNNDNVEK
jgi:hypothetical protein